MSGAQFNADDASAYGLMGYLGGISAKVKTSGYINSVLNYTHAALSVFFDEWMDAEAKNNPKDFQHMYEWPETWHDYNETVGEPFARLWEHTFSGSGSEAKASFNFLPSKRPTPVDPILLEEGPTGEAVKEGVHIFVWKAMAFEYGMHIKVSPTLAKMLAYVGADHNSGGNDAGWHHANEHESGNMVNFSKGPVEFVAGGGHTTMKFSTAYVGWWQSLAQNKFETQIAPGLAKDIADPAAIGRAIALGRRKMTKNVSITAQASQDAAVFEEAKQLGLTQLEAVEKEYIRRAAARRRRALYGE